MTTLGIVAAGHSGTAEAAGELLRDGGNAFDAVLGGLAAACAAEPLLSSLGGGGFLLAHRADGKPVVYDFFAQTPRSKNLDRADFYPIHGDFGGVTQEFHIGRGSIAVPGVVRGLFEAHRDLGVLPMQRVLEPAIRLGREGAVHNECQVYIESILRPILQSTEAMRRLFPEDREVFRNPELADFFEQLAGQGDDLFYLGEPAETIARDCAAGGGHLTRQDFESYRVIKRAPLLHRHRGDRILLNPPPSAGGTLIAFTLSLLEDRSDRPDLLQLVRAQQLANEARRQAIEDGLEFDAYLQDEGVLESALSALRGHPPSTRGTTHLSVADRDGNIASLTVSNGEGSGYVLPGTGILVNNFLGEEDLHAQGLDAWIPDSRMSSMMCPTLVETGEGRLIALGSGGSNRLRTAILQVLLGILDHGLTLEEAVSKPRIHREKGDIDLEPGLPERELEQLMKEFPGARQWPRRNLFFGGVHAVELDPRKDRFAGAGDSRRNGICIKVA